MGEGLILLTRFKQGVPPPLTRQKGTILHIIGRLKLYRL